MKRRGGLRMARPRSGQPKKIGRGPSVVSGTDPSNEQKYCTAIYFEAMIPTN